MDTFHFRQEAIKLFIAFATIFCLKFHAMRFLVTETFLGEEKLRSMLKFLPEQSEIDMINAFTGDKATLANVDRYFLLLSKLPHYKLRIEASIARATFEEDMDDIVPAISNIKKACKGTVRTALYLLTVYAFVVKFAFAYMFYVF